MIRNKEKKSNKNSINSVFGKRTLYDSHNASVAQIYDKSHSFGKPKHSKGFIKNKTKMSIYGNGDMRNTQHSSRNDEEVASATFYKSKGKRYLLFYSSLYQLLSNLNSKILN